MKRKLTILMFGLLLAVGWTSNAFAQSAVYKASVMESENWTYKWLPEGATDSVPVPYINPQTHLGYVVTDPYQIYDLLRAVYMDKRLPGPTYSAWDSSNKPSLTPGNREDAVYYGGIGGGWNIGATTTGSIPTSNMVITGNYYIYIQSIVLVADGDTLPQKWDAATMGTSMPTGWSATRLYASGTYSGTCYFGTNNNPSGSITIPGSLFAGHNSVKVVVTGFWAKNNSNYGSLGFNGVTDDRIYSSEDDPSLEPKEYGVTISAPETVVADGTYTPAAEGYTALVVAVKNENKLYVESANWLGSCSFRTKEEIVDWIANNIESVQLLTDGLRVGDASKYTTGTVFNCSGTYNKFFFLSKGQARKKSTYVKNQITNGNWPSYAGEELPFKAMYEEFSPTGGEAGAQISDFYIEMMDGAVYDVAHDCASVIQNGHQFSMSGNNGTQKYAMSGMNFFIPDYRLMLWWNPATINNSTRQYVDGRDFVPYRYYTGYGSSGWTTYENGAGVWSANYAQYNPTYAPKVGLYTLTLDAEAKPCEGYADPGNTNYVVTLDWTSSLNEMSGKDVPQTYIIYEVTYNADGSEKLVPIDTVQNTTHYDFGGKLWPQGEHSQEHTYIIMGWPTDNDHPSFIAWSNQDDIVIPGLNDFLMLDLDHYESDFDVPNVTNWYRNFLMVNNDGYKGLTTKGIFAGDSVFNVLRYENLDSTATQQVARIKFENQQDGRVKYTVNYVDQNGTYTQNIEPYNIKEEDEDGNEIVKVADAYQLNKMGIDTVGYYYIKSSRDIIIKPNGYGVSVSQITLTVGNDTYTWRASSGTTWPTGWSAQGKWTKDEGSNYYYMDGNGTGYILISGTSLGNATTATLTINAFGDPGKTAKIDVNGTTKTLLNGEENRKDYTWDLQFNSAKLNAPSRASGSVTVADGTTHNGNLPVYGNYFEVAQKNQMIYSANLLSQAGIPTGATITSLTFYPYPGNGSFWDDPSGINFHGGNVKLSLGITSSDYFSSNATLNENVTLVGQTGTITANSSATEFTITFTTPYTYNGGNLLVQIDTEAGEYSPTYFMGQNQGSNVSIYTYGSTSRSNFLPKATFTYTEGGGGDDPIIDPTVDGLVRIANLPLVDQFAVAIPDANNHPYRYSYYLKLADADSTSNTVRVPVQHTGAKIEGYYTEDEMDEDTNPENFLTENVISAQVDMTLSPTSAPYFYTINSKKGGVPADAWSNYLSVLQRREAGDYEEMQTRANKVDNPYYGDHYDAGAFSMLDYRGLTSANTDTAVSYVPIVWTKGIDRHWYVEDTLHNSYGAPIWRVKRGDVNIDAIVQKQTSNSGGWNPSVNWYVKNDAGTDSTAYGLYFVGFTATGILPVNPGIEYEPYMFRVWLVDSTESLRNYTWEYNAQGKPIKIVDAGARPGKWFLLDEKMCDGVDDLVFQVDITTDYVNNLQFAGPLYGFKPDVVARFYYKVKDQDAPVPSGLRGLNDDNNVGYVVLKGVRPDPSTAVHEIKIVGEIVSQTYYNVQGLESDRPFDGVNIVVTRFSDGSVSTSKVIK